VSAAIARSRRAWGWHRLADEWAARVVEHAEVKPGELVLDIGAGTGALTAHLVLQRAVVRRYAGGSGPGATRRARRYRVTTGLAVPRRAFQPPPRVDSAVLVIRRR
jgi:16S rRNA A1518/A1519 N6-dimethyltransferase RsmA/KsgA/DIM1 with predicted DNA glycosylase/AP lyase activity